MEALRLSSIHWAISFFWRANAVGPFRKTFSAICPVASFSSPGETTLLIKPMRWASMGVDHLAGIDHFGGPAQADVVAAGKPPR